MNLPDTPRSFASALGPNCRGVPPFAVAVDAAGNPVRVVYCVVWTCSFDHLTRGEIAAHDRCEFAWDGVRNAADDDAVARAALYDAVLAAECARLCRCGAPGIGAYYRMSKAELGSSPLVRLEHPATDDAGETAQSRSRAEASEARAIAAADFLASERHYARDMRDARDARDEARAECARATAALDAMKRDADRLARVAALDAPSTALVAIRDGDKTAGLDDVPIGARVLVVDGGGRVVRLHRALRRRPDGSGIEWDCEPIEWRGIAAGQTAAEGADMATTKDPEAAEAEPTRTQAIGRALAADAHDAAWRTAGAQFVKLAREPLVALLARHLGPDDESTRARVAAFLDTEIGAALVAGMLAAGLSALPGAAGEVPARLARELRVRAMADAGDLLADVLMGPLREVASLYLRGVTAVDAAPAELPEPAVRAETTGVRERDPVGSRR